EQRLDESGIQQLVLRMDYDGKKIVYIECTNLISTFDHNVPDAYAEFKDRIIFIYSSKKVSVDEKLNFQRFYNQFKNSLGNDITVELTHNPSFSYGMIHHIETWRVELDGKPDKSKKIIPRFPNKTFYEDFLYNDEGFLVYKDGVYTETAVDPHQWEPDNFDLRDYILQKTSVPEYTLQDEMIVAIIVIDEKGRVIESVIEGLNSVTLEEEVKEALTRMRAWNPGKIDGKPVKVRLRQRL
ncbi:MAG: hypothetical protein O9262_05785, partial [Cyclobacteriaceae bacterium]|nr:hypothetical protein [Cyclobacteriaceae bacterium]